MRGTHYLSIALVIVLAAGCDALTDDNNESPQVQYLEPTAQTGISDTLSGSVHLRVRATDDRQLQYVRVRFGEQLSILPEREVLYDWTIWPEPSSPNEQGGRVAPREIVVDTVLTLPQGVRLVPRAPMGTGSRYSFMVTASDGRGSVGLGFGYASVGK